MARRAPTVDLSGGAEPAASARRRLGPDERRAQLITAGVELLQSQPLDLLTAGHIAERTGVSKALVYHYFPTHQDLQAAVARAAADELLAGFSLLGADADAPVEARVEAGIEAFLSFVEQQPLSYASLAKASASDALLHEVFEDTRQGVVDIVMANAGLDEPSPRLRMVVRGWVALAEQMINDWVTEPYMERADLVAFLRRTFDQIAVEALGTPP